MFQCSGIGRSMSVWVIGWALVLGTTTMSFGQDKKEEDAVKAIKKFGAEVTKKGSAYYVDAFGEGRTDSQAKDEMMAELKHLPNLYSLIVSSAVTDEGIAHLKDCRSLQELTVNINVHVTDKSLEHIAKVPTLTLLFLGNAPKFTNDGLANLEKLKGLKTLSLVTLRGLDEGAAKPIAKITTLERVSIQNGPFTDASLKEFENLKNLKEFYMYGSSKTTRDGRAALRKALPGCMFDKTFGK